MNPRYWANFDPKQPKKVGLIIDVATSVKAFVTPESPDADEAILRDQAQLGPGADNVERGPII